MKVKSKKASGSLTLENGMDVIDKDKAEAFNKFLSRVFTNEDFSDVPTPKWQCNGEHLENLNITPNIF